MVKFKTPLVLVLASVVLSGCIRAEPQQPVVTPAKLQTALLESENRIQETWREYCAGVNDIQKKHQASLNEIQTSQAATSRHLVTIIDKLDEQPAPVVLPSPQASQKCPAVTPATFDNKIILGRTEWIWLEAVNRVFRARVDSGATTSSLSAHHIVEFERDGKKWVRFNMVPDDDVDDSYEVEAPLVRYARIRQASSQELDRRPVVEMTVKIGTFTDTAEFTLTDRSSMTYPILLGREFLRDIALIDVAKSYHQPKPEPLEDRPSSAPDADENN
ncbi:ATP-dependent zinc protease [Methylophaga sp. OBS3]|uniref:ATP-dependent zinc protease family protein n=1 Tax=Methylophaga sp. OBS3 TaxID=2991934 RepID=UPI00225C1481|nr:ATP-dependent zinc protease [Methylophaga sp. OBS3]MCX4188848.1 ATP-dependent zinc protease [Methylophaga sp. OBS3]